MRTLKNRWKSHISPQEKALSWSPWNSSSLLWEWGRVLPKWPPSWKNSLPSRLFGFVLYLRLHRNPFAVAIGKQAGFSFHRLFSGPDRGNVGGGCCWTKFPYAKILNHHHDSVSLKNHEALTRVKIICEAFPSLSDFFRFHSRYFPAATKQEIHQWPPGLGWMCWLTPWRPVPQGFWTPSQAIADAQVF